MILAGTEQYGQPPVRMDGRPRHPFGSIGAAAFIHECRVNHAVHEGGQAGPRWIEALQTL